MPDSSDDASRHLRPQQATHRKELKRKQTKTTVQEESLDCHEPPRSGVPAHVCIRVAWCLLRHAASRRVGYFEDWMLHQLCRAGRRVTLIWKRGAESREACKQ
eukprot:6476970-Amphidinium_carterae.1